MNFEFGNYNARLTFNPADVTIRMENRENKRLYETIFVAEDFEGLATIGGLTTLENILKTGFEDDDSGATIKVVEEKIDYICLKVEVKGLIPVSWTIRVAARRRESSDTAVEVEELRERIKYLNKEIEELQLVIDCKIYIPGCPIISDTIHELHFIDNYDILPITCTTPNCPTKIIKRDRLSTYISYHHPHGVSQANTFQCSTGHWVHLPLMEYIKYVNQLPFDLSTNTYTVQNLQSLEGLFGHSNLFEELHTLSISIKNGTWICNFGNFMKNKVPILKKLTLHCPNLENIDGIENCKTLEEIDLEGCSKLTNVNMLAKLPALTKLNIKGTAVKNTTALTNSRLTIEK